MANELRHGRKLARHRGALLAGQEPRRLLLPADPRPQVGPRTSRPARGLQDSCTQRKAVVAGRAPGSATSAPLSVKGRSDKAVPYPKWRALVRGHARARPRGAPAKRAGARLPLKARALYVTVLRTPASGDPGLQLRRGPAGRPAAHERRRHPACSSTRPRARCPPAPHRAKPDRPTATDGARRRARAASPSARLRAQ